MSILNSFKGYNNLKVNIAQIILVAFLLPLVAVICYLVSAADPGRSFYAFMLSLMDEIPLCKMSFGLLSQYVSGSGDFDVTQITFTVFLKAFPETILVGVLIHFFNNLFQHNWNAFKATLSKKDARLFKPLPILPAFLGLLCATLLVNLFDLFKNDLIAIAAEIGLIVIIVIAIRFMFNKKFKMAIFSLKKILLFVIDGIYGIIISVFVSAMAIIASGLMTDIGEVFSFAGIIVGCTVVASILVWFVNTSSDYI